jgi:hypothetical protein
MRDKAINRRTVLGVSGAALLSAGGLWSVARAQPKLNLADFGVSPSATPQTNLAAFRKAVAAAPAGAVLRLPPTAPLVCRIDTSGGWQGAVQIDKPLTLQIDGDLQATHGGIRNNPPFMLNITAPGVTLNGSGRIIGDGSFDDSNGGTDETMPGLVRVAADGFTMTGIELVSPPKIGLLLYQCRNARIDRARFSGGPSRYRDTGHFAIRAAGGGRHIFSANRFYPAPDGGMCVQCIMLSTSHDNLFTDNHAQHPYEKLVYGFGDRNVARNNVVVGNPGYIPGTNVQGTITAVFRFHGSFNRVEANQTSNCAGGAQMMDGTAHQVMNNRFLGCGQSALSAYQSDLSNSRFSGNVGTRAALAGFLAGDGMRLISDRGPARNLIVEDNEIVGFSAADPIATISPWTSRQAFGRNSLVKPGTGNGRYYIALNDGRSGPREPRWPDTPGAIVTDGTLRWATTPFEGGQAEIKLSGRGATAPIVDSLVRNNKTRGGRLGIVTQFVTRSRISNNQVDASAWAMVEEGGNHNRWEGNRIAGTASRTVRNLARTSTLTQ